MPFSAALLAMSAVQAASQIGQGYAQKAESKYNATLLEGKANLIEAQSDITNAQYEKTKGKYLSASMVGIAKAGIMPNGSAAAVMLDTQTQIGIDQAISKVNYQQEKNYTLAQAGQQKRAGRQAVYSGYSNAFSTMLQAGSNYAMYNKKSTTFDSNSAIPRMAGE